MNIQNLQKLYTLCKLILAIGIILMIFGTIMAVIFDNVLAADLLLFGLMLVLIGFFGSLITTLEFLNHSALNKEDNN